jgi:D-aspartate ligase
VPEIAPIIKRLRARTLDRVNTIAEYIVLGSPTIRVPKGWDTPNFDLRRAGVADVPGLIKVWPDEFARLSASREQLRAELEDRFERGIPCFVAVDRDRILGAVWAKPWEYADVLPPSSPGETLFESANLFVVPEARNRKVSIHLLRFAVEEMGKLGAGYALGLAYLHRSASIATSQRIGFRRLGLLQVGRRGKRIRRLVPDYTADLRTRGLPPAVIAGSDSPNVLAMVRSLGRHGIACHLVLTAPPRKVNLSRYCRSWTVVPPEAGDDVFALALQDTATRCGDRPVLFCCNDVAIERVGRLDEPVLELFLPASEPRSAAAFCHKRVQLDRARDAGVDVPETIFFRTRSELESQLTASIFPSICKPVAAAAQGSFAHKTMRFETPDALRSALGDVLDAADAELMLQRYIAGDDQQVLFCLVAVDATGEAPVFVTGRKVRQTPPGAGFMASGQTADLPDVAAASAAYLRDSRLRGLMGLEFKRDPETGRLVFIEISTRPENFHGIAAAAGVDLPYIAYCQALGIPVESRAMPREVRWIAGMDDLVAARTLLRDGRLRWAEYLRSVRGPRVWSVWSWRDPVPFGAALAELLGHLAGSSARRIGRRE